MKEYRKAILTHYEAVKNDRYPDILLHPTTGNLKTLCVLLFDTLNADDRIIYARFFKSDSPASTLDFNDVKKFDVDKFRPLVRFLRGGASPTNPMAIEILAILVDFRGRPLKKFNRNEVQEMPENNVSGMVNEPTPVYGKENEEGGTEEKMDDEVSESTVTSSVQDIYPENPDRKAAVIPQKVFAMPVRQNNTRANRIKLAGLIILMLFAGVYLIISIFREKGCMMWKGDHYEEVSCDLEVNPTAGNKVIPIKRDLLLYQKKIIPTDTTTFFNPDREARIFYGRGASKEYEYFTYPGKHPETRNDLKPITSHIISNHIKKEH